MGKKKSTPEEILAENKSFIFVQLRIFRNHTQTSNIGDSSIIKEYNILVKQIRITFATNDKEFAKFKRMADNTIRFIRPNLFHYAKRMGWISSKVGRKWD